MKSFILAILYVILLFSFAGCLVKSQGQASEPVSSNSIKNKGSDTMVNLALAWAEDYQSTHPEINISVTGGGSGSGIASLINGTIDLANASRRISAIEIKQAEAQGYTPIEFIVARDAIAIVVSPLNPVRELTIEQLSRIYRGEITNWLEVGGENRPIVKLSRETNSGTHIYFLETVVRMDNKEDRSIFSPDTLLLPSSEGIIAEVKDNPNAIGYDGLGYITPDVEVIAVARDNQSPYIYPSIETVNNNLYPISRDMFIYTKGEPQGTILEFLDYIRSEHGQNIVNTLGFVPYFAGEE